MQHQRLREVIRRYAQCPPEALGHRLDERISEQPRCPVTRFLLGCQCFDRNRPATAVRHMMIAHHGAPDLESAALLVFAGMNWIARRGSPLLAVLLDTWEEFRRPEFDRTHLERTLLDAFAEPRERIDAAAPLARQLWRLPLRTLRRQLVTAVGTRDAALYPLLTAPL